MEDPSGSRDWVQLERPEAGGEWARIVMQREPVNSMNYSLWKRLSEVLRAAEEASDIRGVVITSGIKRPVFSAGNDLAELYAPNTSRDRYKRFWMLSNSFLCSLYTTPLITVAAIKGACPAGGCIISLCCDYRVMTDTGRIGLNEVELGIPVPKYWALLMGRVVGTGVADKLCSAAQMCTPRRALEIGMLDEVAGGSQLLQAAETALAALLRLPDVGRVATKQQARTEFADAWRKCLEAESEVAFTQLQQPATVQALRGVLQRLGGGGADRSRL